MSTAAVTELDGVAAWDDESTVRYYNAFTRAHDRYHAANTQLVARAGLSAAMYVLDLAAGTGLTAQAALPSLGPEGRIVCVEPAAAMRRSGEAQTPDRRVRWRADLPPPAERFDRVLCGAALWQLPLATTLAAVHARLVPGGRFAFDVPSLYLGIPDEPGGGADPLLLALPAALARARLEEPAATASWRPLTVAGVSDALAAAGFSAVETWTFETRLTQAALRDWLKLPPINRAWFGDRAPEERAALIDELYKETDADSWRPEGWHAWVATR